MLKKASINSLESQQSSKHKIGHWLVYLVYLIVLALTISKHELWGDEVHSWNISKHSTSLLSLVENTRFEGHPPLWYTLLFVLSRFTHNVEWMQVLHFFISAAFCYVFVFYSRLPVYFLLLILCGYYFIYEYSVLSRNYSLGVLFAFLLCVILKSDTRYKFVIYYFLLMLLSNSHFVGLLLAFSIHIYFLQTTVVRGVLFRLKHLSIGILVMVFAGYFIFPPSDSSLGMDFWRRIWTNDQYLVALQVVIKAMLPMPIWSEFHFWNTNYFTDLLNGTQFVKIKSALLSLVLICMAAYVLWKDRPSLLLFLSNVFLTSLVALFFPMITARYVGYVFIGFVVALWLLNGKCNLNHSQKIIAGLLLLLQIPGGIFAVQKDWSLPFSQSEQVESVVAMTGDSRHLITDYWSLNYLTAITDKPYYCVGYNIEKSFLQWNQDMSSLLKMPYLYRDGINNYFNLNGTHAAYLFSNNSIDQILSRDSLVTKYFDLKLISERNGSIEKYSNIYLYLISKK